MISGYLFFQNLSGTTNDFIKKLKKRFKTLTVPYLFWSGGVLLMYSVLQLFPAFQAVFEGKWTQDFTIGELLNKIFINPIPFQLWFIRDLMILVLLTPIIFWLIKRVKFYFIILLFLSWLLDINYVIFENRSLLFFSWGAILGINKSSIIFKDASKYSYFFTFIWLILVIGNTILKYFDLQNFLYARVLEAGIVTTGILCIWAMYDSFSKGIKDTDNKLYNYTSYSFFVFLFHVPIFSYIRKVLFSILGKTEFSSVIIYFSVPTLTIILSILVGFGLKHTLPTFYNIITGNR